VSTSAAWKLDREADTPASGPTDCVSEREARNAIPAMIERMGGRSEWRRFATDSGPKTSNETSEET
jgi:hypothetical protein